MAALVAVCVVAELRKDDGPVGVTAIDKRAVTHAVKVRKLGLVADVQADRKYHGGESKAVYAYAVEDVAYWESELGRPLHPGWFGENLLVEGIDVSGAKPGDRWRIGDSVVLEVTSPRHPCQTFARWVGGADARGWVKRFTRAGRPGAYLRVVHTGAIVAGDEIRVESTARATAPTIAQMLADG